MVGWIDVHWIEGLEMIVVPPGETVVLVVARSRRVASKPLAHLSSLFSHLSSLFSSGRERSVVGWNAADWCVALAGSLRRGR